MQFGRELQAARRALGVDPGKLTVPSDVSLDVGFYYSANAAGRLVGTLLSGVLYLWGGLDAALWGSATFVAITWLLTLRLPPLTSSDQRDAVTSIAG